MLENKAAKRRWNFSRALILLCAATAVIAIPYYLSTHYDFRVEINLPGLSNFSLFTANKAKISSAGNLTETSTPPQVKTSESANKKTAILYLASQARINELTRSLGLLFDNFNREYRYPIIIFYDDKNGKDKFDIPKLLENLKFNDNDKALISFEYLTFVFPDGFTENDKSKVEVWPHAYPMYQHMIAFWGYHMFHHPRITSLEYFFRLDSDSYIKNPVKVDFLKKIRENNYHYAYRFRESDPDWVVRGMAQFLAKYVRDNKLTPAQPSKLQDSLNANSEFVGLTTYYNNFEIVHVPTFLRSDMEQFRKALYDTKRIYTHRWGDAPQRYLMVNLFLTEKEVYEVCETSYEHQHVSGAATC